MSLTEPRRRMVAIQMLVLATAFWALSFPLMKALAQVQQSHLPQQSSWFFASLCVTVRFGVAAVVLLLWRPSLRRDLTGLEIQQGLGLGLFGSLGLLLQMDGLTYTTASVSAFLTQFYCVLIPVYVAWRDRRRPSGISILCGAMVLTGVAILARLDWRDFHLGRGEAETLLGSVLFTGQILWLERPVYAANRANHFSFVMFVVMALTSLPVALLTTRHPSDWTTALSVPSALLFYAIIIASCTLGGYLLMNYWQRFVTSTEAGLIYCAEPVFVSVVTLFLPAALSALAHIDYPNESFSLRLLWGGGLITAANILLQFGAVPMKKVEP